MDAGVEERPDIAIFRLQHDLAGVLPDLVVDPAQSVLADELGIEMGGDGDGDDEQIYVELKKVPTHIHKLVFVVNIYQCMQRKQDFGMIKNAFIRVADASNQVELIHYNITDNFSGLTSLFAGEIYRHGGEWKFSAVGQGSRDTSLGDIANRYA